MYPINYLGANFSYAFIMFFNLAATLRTTRFNHLTPNDHYMGRTAQPTSRCCILYIYSTNILTEYFKHAA